MVEIPFIIHPFHPVFQKIFPRKQGLQGLQGLQGYSQAMGGFFSTRLAAQISKVQRRNRGTAEELMGISWEFSWKNHGDFSREALAKSAKDQVLTCGDEITHSPMVSPQQKGRKMYPSGYLT